MSHRLGVGKGVVHGKVGTAIDNHRERKTVAKKKKYTVKFSIDFCGDYGTKEVIAYEEPDMHELWDMALEHFQPEAEVIDEEELEEGDEGYEEEEDA